MAHAVDRLEHNPEPHEPHGGRPVSPYRPRKTPDAKRHERAVDDYEPKLAVWRDQACQESGGRKRFPEATDVFLDRVHGLSEDERAESSLDARHSHCRGGDGVFEGGAWQNCHTPHATLSRVARKKDAVRVVSSSLRVSTGRRNRRHRDLELVATLDCSQATMTSPKPTSRRPSPARRFPRARPSRARDHRSPSPTAPWSALPCLRASRRARRA